ncbi:MAG: hypothetical protein LBS55_07235 [Prevotellaceae bacterium]|jgi:hypothetical protein|nr:hypothetical protein [Prevotellaceae bacterium]
MDSNVLIKIGYHLSGGDRQACIVEEFLGGGGQGEVYRVKIGSESYALKWYFNHNQTSRLKNSLAELIKRGAPSENFLVLSLFGKIILRYVTIFFEELRTEENKKVYKEDCKK